MAAKKSSEQKKAARAPGEAQSPSGESVVAEVQHETSGEGALEQRIAERAYQLYVDRGGEEGHAVDDWLQAEREVRDT